MINGKPLWRFLRGILRFVFTIPVILAILWAAGALVYDLPFPAWLRITVSLCWLIGALAAWFAGRPRMKVRGAVMLGFGLILGWWFTLQPSASRDWKQEVAVLAHADVKGDQLTIHNIRNFNYQAADTFTPQYEIRTYDLTKLEGLDIFLSTWGSDFMGHPVVSFDFGADGHLAFSIEIRPEKGESFSPVASVYRQYELIYLPADELDIVRVRTNYRAKEDVCLYRVKATPEQARQRLLQYVARLNELHTRPEWYNVVTANCTTSIRAQNPRTERLPWDWRMLFNGRADEMLYELGALDHSFPFEELRRRSRINEAARAAGDAPDFSTRIRQGLPGF
jgi:hypothetical protein